MVDSGASMHMLSRKDLSSAELEALRKSRNPTTVNTANDEVQTSEEAQVYVHDHELFVTVQILDDTPAVLSLGKFCEEHGFTYEWTSGQKSHLTKKWKTNSVLDRKIRSCCCPRIVFKLKLEFVFNIIPAGLIEYLSPSPARRRSDDTHAQTSGSRGDLPNIQIKNQENGSDPSNEKSIARSPRVVGGSRRKSRRYRSASTREHFS